jgi:hypothetical protein
MVFSTIRGRNQRAPQPEDAASPGSKTRISAAESVLCAGRAEIIVTGPEPTYHQSTIRIHPAIEQKSNENKEKGKLTLPAIAIVAHLALTDMLNFLPQWEVILVAPPLPTAV